MMGFWHTLGHAIGKPFRAMATALRFLLNLTGQQMRALFSLAMIGGMIALSLHNIVFTFIAKSAVEKGDAYRPFFALILEQMRFNSALIAWFAVIMGGIVFGADYFRAKWGDKEMDMGKGRDGAPRGEGQ